MNDHQTLILLHFTLPVWYVAGFADWICHRRSKIELTSGILESAMHAIMFCEIGMGLLPGLFLEVNALIIAVMMLALILHEATALFDVSYALTLRPISRTEHHVHSFLEVLPLMAITSVIALHWGQFLAIFGLGHEQAQWTFQWKSEPLPTAYLAWTMAVIFVFHFLTYSEEIFRCWRARA